MSDIPRRTRYEVLRRDNYACHYCGAKAPDVKLNVDAVIPVVLGGSHKDPTNLITACEACNGGKSSSAPDAPLVAKVNDRALEWAQAMRQAQAKMLDDFKARQASRQQFAEWWDCWTYEDAGKRHAIPRPGDWEQTVDQLVAAGLPLVILKDCIDRAMGRTKVGNSAKFRYMCGIAWSKLTELQKAARSIAGAGGQPDSDPEPDSFEDGRRNLADELLDGISDEERAHFLAAADANDYLSEDEQQTETQIACEAVDYALNSARSNLAWLVERLKKTLQGVSPDIGEPCLAEFGKESSISDPLSRMALEASNALYVLEDLTDFPDAAAYINKLPEDEAREWLLYADSLYSGAELSPERLLVRAMDCAKAVKDGKHWDVMCLGPGEHIRRCPNRATRCLRFDGPECCRDGGDDHDQHRFCEHHSEMALAGELKRGSDGPVKVLSWTVIDERAAAEVPF